MLLNFVTKDVCWGWIAKGAASSNPSYEFNIITVSIVEKWGFTKSLSLKVLSQNLSLGKNVLYLQDPTNAEIVIYTRYRGQMSKVVTFTCFWRSLWNRPSHFFNLSTGMNSFFTSALQVHVGVSFSDVPPSGFLICTILFLTKLL